MSKVPREVIKAQAQARIETVLAALGIRERARGGYLVLCNPVRGEKNPSLQIWVKPGYEGAWKDHGNPDQLKGDVFDLVAYWRGWFDEPARGFEKAADWLTDVLGLAQIAPERQRQLTASARAAQETRAQDLADEDARKERSAKALWLSFDDKPAAAHVHYFKTRGIDLGRLARPPGALRYSMTHKHRESGRMLPCIAAAMQDAEGIKAVHRTFLAPDGSDKCTALGLEPARKIWPHFAGRVITLARGASNLPVKEASEAGIADDLVLCEGVEDGLSIALADPSVRVWAVGSIANLAHVPVPDCASSILVAVDNDWGKPQAAAQLQRGLDYLASFGRPVIEMRSPLGKDVNDLLKGGKA